MNVKELRTLINNLDEYIHVPGGIERLKKTVLHLAVSGQLVPQDPSEGTGDELYRQIQAEKQRLAAEGKIKKQQPLSTVTVAEVPFEVPKNWKWVRLGDVTQFIDYRGKTPKKMSSGIRLVTAKNVRKGFIKNTPEEFISKEDYEPWMTRGFPQNGDVLFTTEAPLANAATFNFNEPIALAQRIITLHPYLFTGDFLTKVINSPNMQEYIFSKATGTTVSGIKASKFKEVCIPLAPNAEQKRIVDKVDVIFSLIDRLTERHAAEQAMREKLVTSFLASLSRGDGRPALSHLVDVVRTHADAAQLRKTILHLAVSGRLVPQDPSEGTGEDLYQQIQASKQKLIKYGRLKKQKSLPEISESDIAFQIPKTWKWVRLADATIFSIGRTPARKEHTYWDSGHMPWVSIADLKAGQHISKTKEKISAKAFDKCFGGIAVPAGSLLYSFKLTIGKMSIIDMDAVHNEAIASFTTHAPEFTQYLFKALEAIDPLSRTNQAIMGKTLNSTSLSLLEIPLPPSAEQARIVAKTTQLLDLVNKFELALETPRVALSVVKEVQLPHSSEIKQGAAFTKENEIPELTNQQKKVQRKMLACFIANESLDGTQFGKTKFEKLLHLVEYHVLRKDLNQRYSVQPAGPYDGAFTRLFWDDVIKSNWFKIEGYGNLQKIVAGDKNDKSQKDYGYLSDDEKDKIRDLIKVFKDWGYGEAEIISTLYAAWNNRLIRGEEISDNLLKEDFLQWDPQKTQYSDRLDRALAWMRQNNIVPSGWGNEIKRAKSAAKVAR